MQMPSPPAAMRLRVEFLLPSMRALKKRKDHGTKRRGKRENGGKREKDEWEEDGEKQRGMDIETNDGGGEGDKRRKIKRSERWRQEETERGDARGAS